MKKQMSVLLSAAAALGFSAMAAQAALVSVSGPSSFLNNNPAALGGLATILASAPSDVRDDPPAAVNTAQQGFNERQGVQLFAPLAVDGGTLAAGTVVDSHMIFLNTRGNQRADHENVVWTFSGDILGVMSNRNGSLEVDSTSKLGAWSIIYPGSPFNARGLESSDSYTVTNNTLNLSMRVTEPGDWIRVVTRADTSVEAPVPLPAAGWMLMAAVGGLAAMRRKRG